MTFSYAKGNGIRDPCIPVFYGNNFSLPCSKIWDCAAPWARLFPGFSLCLAAMPGSSVMAHWVLFFIPGASAGKIRRRRGNPNQNKPASGILSGAGQGKQIYISSRSSSKLLAWEWKLEVFPAFGILRCQTPEGGCAQLVPDLRLLLDLPELEWVLARCKSIPVFQVPAFLGLCPCRAFVFPPSPNFHKNWWEAGMFSCSRHALNRQSSPHTP